jgi:hypothetical protein
LTGDPAMRLTSPNADVPADLESVVYRCLAKAAGERYADVQGLRIALADCRLAGTWTPNGADRQ